MDIVLDLGDFDLQCINLLILNERNGAGLTVLDGLKGQVSQGDVPLTVILLPFPVEIQDTRRLQINFLAAFIIAC